MRDFGFIISLCFIIIQAQQVTSSGVFELNLLSFVNNQSIDADGKCCGRPDSEKTQVCLDRCNTFFRVCLKRYQSTIDLNSPCTFGEVFTPVLPNPTLGLGEPIMLPFVFKWTGLFSLIVEAFHQDPTSTSGRRLIFRLATQRWLEVGTNWTRNSHQSEIGTFLSFSFRVFCDEHYYGRRCSTFCKPRDDKFGHYSCSLNGTKLCFLGWKGEYCSTAVCAPGCHDPHGYCDFSSECKCRLGWSGRNCDQCVRYPGCKHGTCIDPWQCICHEGWSGLFCNQDRNYCISHKPCKNGGVCTNTGQGSYTCTFPESYKGTNCESKDDDCTGGPCLNGATCMGLGVNLTCQCLDGFSGSRCEISSVLRCAEHQCRNGGICVPGVGGYTCRCSPEYEGKTCQIRKGECSSSPCENGGICVSRVGDPTYNCICPVGFVGHRCDQRFVHCANEPCLNGGKCINGSFNFYCQCVKGFVGALCQKKLDNCKKQPCGNFGICHDLGNDYNCKCEPAFTGKNCDTRVGECSNNLCLNGATSLSLGTELTTLNIPVSIIYTVTTILFRVIF